MPTHKAFCIGLIVIGMSSCARSSSIRNDAQGLAAIPSHQASCGGALSSTWVRAMPAGSAGTGAAALAAERPPSSIPKDGGQIEVRAQPALNSSASDAQEVTVPNGMVLIIGGTFQMGTAVLQVTETGDDEMPAHPVRVDSFYMDRTEVTAEAFGTCVAAGKCLAPGKCNWGKPELSQHPINCVNWSAAKKYCEWVGKRLPTEAEWEFAARGREGRKYPWGAAMPDKQLCWHRQHAAGTCQVGSVAGDATPEEVLDLAGNVMEWVSDAYCSYGRPSHCDSRRVMRGCNYVDVKPYLCRGARRAPVAPGNFYNTLGFRCVASLQPGSTNSFH